MPKNFSFSTFLLSAIALSLPSLPLNAGISVSTGLPASALISNPTSSNNGNSKIKTAITKGNSFVLTSPQTVTSVTFMVNNVTDVSGTITLDFYNLSGTPDSTAGNGQVPTGASLMTQSETLPSSPSLSAGDYVTITLNTPLTLTAGNYAFAISTADTEFKVELNNSNAYAQGELMKKTSSWSDRANDLVFAIEGSPATPDLASPATWPPTILEVAPQATAQSSQVSSSTSQNQTFTIVGGAKVESVLLQLDDTNASADLNGKLKLEIFADDGTGQPTGAALASHTGSIPAGASTGDFLQFNFDSTVSLPAGGYVFTISTTDADVLLNATNTSLIYGITGTARPAPSNGPNIVFVLVDDWGWTDHSNATMATDGGQHYESDYYQTPNFDKLVTQGVALTSTYAQPNCAPTRAALLSGQYSPRHGNGVYNVATLNRAGKINGVKRTTYTTPADQGGDHATADEQSVTIGEAFYNSGYVTAHIGKYHVGSSDPADPTNPLNQGFDYNYGGGGKGNPGSYFASNQQFGNNVGPELDAFAADYTAAYIADNIAPYDNGNNSSTLVGKEKYITDAVADAFISFMNDHKSGSLSAYPVYVQLHFYAVHTPIQPRSDLKAKYQGITSTDPRHTKAAYAALIEAMDHSLGRVLDYLDDPNGDGNTSDSIASNTLVIFSSDNGGHEGETVNTPLRGVKGMHYQGGIRVPTVMRMPGTIPAGKVSDTLVHVVDFYPTMLDFAGGVYPNATTHPLDGVSLFDHIKDPDNVPRNRKPIFYHFPGYLEHRAYNCSVVIKEINGKRYKFIYNYDPYYEYETGKTHDQYQLYNLTDDISETVNLLDYIDIENPNDPNDPSSSEEYQNYLAYKNIANNLAADLHNWLDHGSATPNAPADPTWSPIYGTYKSNYPNIAQAKIGQETGPAPSSIPELAAPLKTSFNILSSSTDAAHNTTLNFSSVAGITYQIQTSTNLNDWVNTGSPITATSGTTSITLPAPNGSSEARRFYRVKLIPFSP